MLPLALLQFINSIFFLGKILVFQLLWPSVLCAPVSQDHITQHLRDGAASLQKAAYETGENINNGLQNGAINAYSGITNRFGSLFSGVGRLANRVGKTLTAPYSYASNRITSAIRNIPTSILPSAVTNIPTTIGNVPAAIGNVPSAVGNGIWNGSSKTVNVFGRSLVLNGQILQRYAKRLEKTGRSIENHEWVRVPRQQQKK